MPAGELSAARGFRRRADRAHAGGDLGKSLHSDRHSRTTPDNDGVLEDGLSLSGRRGPEIATAHGRKIRNQVQAETRSAKLRRLGRCFPSLGRCLCGNVTGIVTISANCARAGCGLIRRPWTAISPLPAGRTPSRPGKPSAINSGAANRCAGRRVSRISIFSKKITDVRRRLPIRRCVSLSARPTLPLQLEKGD
jgi:hypothetical protein